MSLNDSKSLHSMKRQIIRKLPANIKFTKFQKERLYWELLCIRLDYEVTGRFIEYIDQHKFEVDNFLSSLDVESRNNLNKVIENLEYMNTHTLVQTLQKFTSNMDKLLEHLNYLESIKNDYILPLELHEEGIFKYKHGLNYLPQEVIKGLRGSVFLDCGAFTGDSASMFEKEYFPSSIYSFEPNPESLSYLSETIKFNKLERVFPVNKAVGEESGVIYFSLLGISSCVSDSGSNEIEVASIDEFVKNNNLSVGLIKMDLEGYEFEALNGAKKTIKQFNPVLLISIYHHPEELFGTKKLIQEITPQYNFKIRHLADIRPLGEIHLIGW
jgi:FkbM family methyltransferase